MIPANLVDMIFAFSTLLFVVSDAKQVHKIYTIKEVTGLSFTHYKLKIIAIILMLIGYTLSCLYLSIVVSMISYTLSMTALVLMIKYRGRHNSKEKFGEVGVNEEE